MSSSRTSDAAQPRRLALLVEYDGSAFSGSQAQAHARTVQGEMEAAIEAFTGERLRVAFAGRTDAGVHARGQVATWDTHTSHSTNTVYRALNAHLPEDLAVRSVAEVDATFEPRRAAVARQYRYRILHGRSRSPLRRRDCWHRRQRLDVEAMHAAASLLPVGQRRNWAAFAGPLDPGVSPERRLDRILVQREGANRLDITMEAESFLPHQVRRVVGALVRVGSGALTPQAFAELRAGPAGSAGPTAPALGLTLEAVRYPPGMVRWHGVDRDADRNTLDRDTVIRDDNEDVPPRQG